VSPFTGRSVETVLSGYYVAVPEDQAQASDILVWRAPAPDSTPHSAVLTQPVLTPGKKYLDFTARLQTKNGILPETNMSLEELIALYGESYNVYRRQ
jgi:hypothetical protein